MGCDIHAFVEYIDPNWADQPRFLAKVHIRRDYSLFGIMAGVRRSQGLEPVSLPKGLPKEISYQLQSEAYLFVVDKEEINEQGCCTRKDAERWGNNYVDEKKKFVQHPDWHSHSWLSLEEVREVIRRYSRMTVESDFITLKDADLVPDGYKIKKDYNRETGHRIAVKSEKAVIPVEFLAIRDMMKAVERNSKMITRLVFYFDN
jgi:hypothetical protein